MPRNFAFFRKPLDKFLYKFDNPEINCQEIFPASFKNIENRKGFKIGPQIQPIFPPDFVFTSERPHYSLALFSSFICTCTTIKRYKFASKRALDYFPKKYPEYANNWLVVTDSSDSRNGERHGSSCRMQYFIMLLGL